VNNTHITISFLNNAADDVSEDDSHSYGLIVQLNLATFPMTAVALAQYDRPDAGLTRKRGNLQIVTNGNVVVGWSDRSYVSEFTAGGSVVMEASLTRFGYDTYRAYKFDIRLEPIEPPVLKAFASDPRESVLTTICYVSWNGATEVASWRFFGQLYRLGYPIQMGHVLKSNFESAFIYSGYMPWVWVEALDKNENILIVSELRKTLILTGSNPSGTGKELAIAEAMSAGAVRNGTEENSYPKLYHFRLNALSWVWAFSICAATLYLFCIALYALLFKDRIRQHYVPLAADDGIS
jgi:hypothetical protein